MQASPLTTQIDVGGVWLSSIFIGCLLIVLGLLWNAKDIAIEARLLWGYIIGYCLFLMQWPSLHFGLYTTAFKASAGEVLAEIVIIPLGALFFKRQILFLLPFIISFEIACIWLGWDGLMVARSLNMALCALAIPFLPNWLKGAVFITIVSFHGSTAATILFAQSLGFALKDKSFRKLFLISTFLLIAAVLIHHDGPFLSGAERIVKYKEFMNFWATRTKWIILGVGPGTFLWTSLMLDHFKDALYMQMHSDFLQTIWELGIVGWGLSVGVFVRAFRNAWEDDNVKYLSALLGVVAFTLTYHPFRFGPSALLTSLIIGTLVIEKVHFHFPRIHYDT